ncbi:MAG TPA: hypothetical protein DEF83_11910 [Brucella melitensis]|nr:hypothetical protein BK219_00075 [Brucella melitensis]HBX03895.1 hypothetical protein [Brucella melitensis]
MVAAKATLDRSFRFILFLLWWGGIVRTAPKQPMPVCKWRFSAFRCSCTFSTLRSGTRKSPFSPRPAAF